MDLRIPAQYRLAESLERYLGDPTESSSRVPFAAALEMDEREEYPVGQHALLDSWGLPEMYIPVEHGGRLESFEEVFALLRVLSRRDLTLALSHAITFLGALPVWLAGSDDQKRTMIELIRGGHQVTFALTERAHGSDLLATEFTADRQDEHYVISGEKWLIGNATRASAMTLFVRTKTEGGPRGFSLLFAEKRLLDPAGFQDLPKVPTLGLRGSDLSGIRVERCALPLSACIGPAGSGLELALKTLQITRILCAGLSLGAGDTALRLAVDFALKRQLYKDKVFAIPHARATLANAFIDLMICDCVAISAVRALQACPGQASVWSAVTKYFVPTRVESAIRDLSVVLGARFFLRAGHPWSMFQKMARDASIVSVFEGSTLVQLHALGLQLELLTGGHQTAEPVLHNRLETIFSLTAALPPFEPAELDLVSRDRDDAVAGMPLLCDGLRAAGVSETLLDAALAVLREFQQLAAELDRARGLPARGGAQLHLARQYTHVHVAACCIGFWIYNQGILGEFFGREEWLMNCLNRLSGETLVEDPRLDEELLACYRDQRLFSVVPFQLAVRMEGGPHE